MRILPLNTFKVGEMLHKRTDNTKTWMNFDGSYTTEIHSGLVHYEDENGNLQNINTDLYDEADFDQIDFPVAKDGDSLFYEAKEKSISDKKKNRMDREKFDFQGLQVPFDCKIPRNIKRGYSIGKGQSKLTFIPVGASSSRGYVEGNKVTYPDVWNDADLILELLPNGVKETIILKTEKAPFHVAFEVKGELEEELKIQPPWLQDANGVKRDVVQGVYEEENKTFISLAADVSGLIYPIAIDPTVIIQPDGAAGKDNNTYSAQPTTDQSSTYLYAGNDASGTYRTFIQFDLSTIPNGASVSTANMELYDFSNNSATAIAMNIHEVTAAWVESLTWNTAPTYNAAVLTSTTITAQANYYSFNVLSLLSEWVNGTKVNNGLMIKSSNEGVSQWKAFSSSEHATVANRPKLVVTYNAPPTAPVVTAPNGGETWNSSHTVAWGAAIDPIDKIGDATPNGTAVGLTNTAGSQPKAFQSFIAPYNTSVSNIRLNISDIGTTPAASLRMSVYSTDVNGFPLTELGFANMTNAVGLQSIGLSVPITANTKYAIVISLNSSTSSQISIRTTGVDTTIPNGNGGYYGPAWANYGVDLSIEISFSNSLQYQVQLSTDNGGAWKDIIALTSAGASSFLYDFINEAQSSTCLIRIRAYDGSAYGVWDQSNGVFSIIHNTAPTAPTNLLPTGVFDRALVQRLSWKHNDPQNDTQSKFDLQWRSQGAGTWNTITQSVVSQYWDAPTNTFPKGTIEWQVRTYDQAGLSGPYSPTSTFISGDRPALPTIVSPSSVSVANPIVQWSSVDQVGYSLNVKDSNSVSVFSVDRISTNKAETISSNLANQNDYTIEFKTKNVDGLYSDLVTKSISVSYTPPAMPVIETVKGNSYIQLNIVDPVPQGTQPSVLYHEIYKEIDGSFVLIAENVQNDFKDFHISSNETVQYFVRAIGNNGTFSDTLNFSDSIEFKGVWLHLLEDPVNTIKNFKIDGSGRSSKWSLENAVHQFQGRKNPVVETGEMSSFSVDFNLKILDIEEHQALEKILYSQQTVCYRDGRGRKVFGVFVDVPFADERWGYSTSLSLMKIDFKEGIE
jgi:hypothetical protein